MTSLYLYSATERDPAGFCIAVSIVHTIQPSSLALSLASFQALARNSDTVIGVLGLGINVCKVPQADMCSTDLSA